MEANVGRRRRRAHARRARLRGRDQRDAPVRRRRRAPCTRRARSPARRASPAQTVLELAAEHGIAAVVRDVSLRRDVRRRRGVLHRHDGRDRRRDRRSTAGAIGDGRVGPVTGRRRRALPGTRAGPTGVAGVPSGVPRAGARRARRSTAGPRPPGRAGAPAPRPASGRTARTRSTPRPRRTSAAPTPRRSAGAPAASDSIAGSKSMPQRRAQPAQHARRVAEQVGGVDHRSAVRPEDLDLLRRSRGRRASASPRTLAYDATTCAGSRIRYALDSRPSQSRPDVRQQVVGHVLLVVHGRRRRAAGRSAPPRRPATASAGWPAPPPGPGWSRPVAAR